MLPGSDVSCVVSSPCLAVLMIDLDGRPRMAVARIALVSPQRSQQIEVILLRMAQTGQLRGRVTEEQLIDLLEQVRPWHVLVPSNA